MLNLNFSIAELCDSEVAKRNELKNVPDLKSADNLLDLIFFCLQPLRELINKPIIITSGFRGAALNKIVGGAVNSQHLKGQAADFQIEEMHPKDIINVIKASDIEFDQLINEYNQWTHISFNKGKNRRQILTY